VSTRTPSGDRKLFASYDEAVAAAEAELRDGFGRFSDLYVVEVKAVVRSYGRTTLEIELTEIDQLEDNPEFWYTHGARGKNPG
jgi:hypothetical protein